MATAEETVATRATVILCAWRNLLAETAECMLQLRDQGWGYVIKRGDALISRSRSIAVSNWYRQTEEDVFLMIDDDVVFEPRGAEKVVELARQTRAIACAAYPVKDGTHLACRRFPGQEIVFGPDSAPVEIIYPATGFMAVHRDVIDAMVAAQTPEGRPHFPLCDAHGLSPMWPFFDTFVLTGPDGGSEYLSEDYAFGEVARQLGFKVWLDPSVTLFHMGYHPYHVHEMAGTVRLEPPRENVPVQTADGFRMYLPEGDGVIARDIRVQGAWDIETRDAIREHLQPGWTFLDLGAHVGYFSLLAASMGNRVIAVEAIQDNRDLLIKNMRLNGYGEQIEVRWGAVTGDTTGTEIMRSCPQNSGAWYRVDYLHDKPDAGDRVVPCYSLGRILADRWPEFLKVDIEGDEYRVLAANRDVLERARAIVVEVSESQLRRNSGVGADDLLDLLRGAGFELRKVIDRGGYSDWLGVKP